MILGIYEVFQPIAKVLNVVNELSEVRATAEENVKARQKND